VDLNFIIPGRLGGPCDQRRMLNDYIKRHLAAFGQILVRFVRRQRNASLFISRHSSSPALRLPVEVHDRDDKNMIRSHLIDDRIRKSMSSTLPRSSRQETPRIRILDDPVDSSGDFTSELTTETFLFVFVISHRFPKLRLRRFQKRTSIYLEGGRKNSSAEIVLSSPRSSA
jgi:hypothetical protein